MSLKIVRNDITKMNTDAIVNTACEYPIVGAGCDSAVYKAAGYDKLLSLRKQIGEVPEGEVFLTPGLELPAKYIIHAVSPHFRGEESEASLRSCYRKSLELAIAEKMTSIAFPLISTGSYGYPKEEGLRIAVDEINAFLLHHRMEVYLVVFDDASVELSKRITVDLESYIDSHYIEEKLEEEYGTMFRGMPSPQMAAALPQMAAALPQMEAALPQKEKTKFPGSIWKKATAKEASKEASIQEDFDETDEAIERLERELAEKMKHMSDTFQQYLLHLIEVKGLKPSTVYNKAIVDKKLFSKIKNNPDYHPTKNTVLRLCVGAGLNMDETVDLLARAGYALSPCDKADVIFSYFIENGIYSMIEIDIQMEAHGLPCIID